MNRVPIPSEKIVDALETYAPTFETIDQGTRLVLTHGTLSIVTEWSERSNDAEFDFFKDGQLFYSDWIEYASGQSADSQVADLVRIANGYFNFDSRVEHSARFGGARQLEYNRGGRWLNVLFPAEGDDET